MSYNDTVVIDGELDILTEIDGESGVFTQVTAVGNVAEATAINSIDLDYIIFKNVIAEPIYFLCSTDAYNITTVRRVISYAYNKTLQNPSSPGKGFGMYRTKSTAGENTINAHSAQIVYDKDAKTLKIPVTGSYRFEANKVYKLIYSFE